MEALTSSTSQFGPPSCSIASDGRRQTLQRPQSWGLLAVWQPSPAFPRLSNTSAITKASSSQFQCCVGTCFLKMLAPAGQWRRHAYPTAPPSPTTQLTDRPCHNGPPGIIPSQISSTSRAVCSSQGARNFYSMLCIAQFTPRPLCWMVSQRLCKTSFSPVIFRTQRLGDEMAYVGGAKERLEGLGDVEAIRCPESETHRRGSLPNCS